MIVTVCLAYQTLRNQ